MCKNCNFCVNSNNYSVNFIGCELLRDKINVKLYMIVF